MPKNICLSRSESSNYRLASAVCIKNDGDNHLQFVEKALHLLPGKHTAAFAAKLDKVRIQRAIKSKLPAAKTRRQLLIQNKENLRKINEQLKGVRYKSNCGIMENDLELGNFHESQLDDMPNFSASSDTCNLVYFDLETSGFKKN